MFNDSVTTPWKEGDDSDTIIPSTALATFQSAIAKYRFNSESPTRSTRLKFQKIASCEGGCVEQAAKSQSSRSKKHKNDEGDAATRKKTRLKRGYAEPERYAHLNELPDILGYRLDVVFCGINPGEYSATVGHHFANPKNHFWRCLFEAGLTVNCIPVREDLTLPNLKPFSLGLTNLVDRPTAEESELSDAELANGALAFLAKIAKYRPYIVCFIGLGIAKTVKAQCLPKGMDGRKTVNVGFQSYKLVHDGQSDLDMRETLFYAMPSTSARVVHFQKGDKVRIMKEMRNSLTSIKQGMFDTSTMHPVRIEVV